MTRTCSAAVARSLAALRRWLKDTWISRLALCDWRSGCWLRSVGRRHKPRPKPPALRFDWLLFEPRWGPDDFTGLGGAPLLGGGLALLGNSVQLPVLAFARGEEPAGLKAPAMREAPLAAWGDYRPAESWAAPLALAGTDTGSGGSADAPASPRASAAPAAAAAPADGNGLDDWLNRVGALLDRPGGAGPDPAMTVAAQHNSGGGGGGGGDGSAPPPLLPAPPPPGLAPGSPASGGDLVAPVLGHPTASPPVRRSPGGSGGVSPLDGPLAAFPNFDISNREPALASTAATPIDVSSPFDLGTANDPMFATQQLGCPYT